MRTILAFYLAACMLLTGCSSQDNGGIQPGEYIQNKGSDTIVNLALAWAEAYQALKPDARISVTGGGSGTGITALLQGTVDIANASRRIKEEEMAAAREAGLDPQEFLVARDAIAVIINPENPVNHLSLEQLSAIYKGEITNWTEVGGEDRPIVCLSRETNSGTHVFFLEAVVRMGKSDDESIFAAETLLLPSSEGIISEVRDNPNAIGYDGLGYITDEVKVLGISAPGAPEEYILPLLQTVQDNSYLLSRDLYMYTQNVPQGAIKEYLQWILGAEAQSLVTELGFLPVVKE